MRILSEMLHTITRAVVVLDILNAFWGVWLAAHLPKFLYVTVDLIQFYFIKNQNECSLVRQLFLTFFELMLGLSLGQILFLFSSTTVQMPTFLNSEFKCNINHFISFRFYYWLLSLIMIYFSQIIPNLVTPLCHNGIIDLLVVKW